MALVGLGRPPGRERSLHWTEGGESETVLGLRFTFEVLTCSRKGFPRWLFVEVVSHSGMMNRELTRQRGHVQQRELRPSFHPALILLTQF